MRLIDPRRGIMCTGYVFSPPPGYIPGDWLKLRGRGPFNGWFREWWEFTPAGVQSDIVACSASFRDIWSIIKNIIRFGVHYETHSSDTKNSGEK